MSCRIRRISILIVLLVSCSPTLHKPEEQVCAENKQWVVDHIPVPLYIPKTVFWKHALVPDNYCDLLDTTRGELSTGTDPERARQIIRLYELPSVQHAYAVRDLQIAAHIARASNDRHLLARAHLALAYHFYSIGDEVSSRAYRYKADSIFNAERDFAGMLRSQSLLCLMEPSPESLAGSYLIDQEQYFREGIEVSRTKMFKPEDKEGDSFESKLLSSWFKKSHLTGINVNDRKSWVQLFEGYQHLVADQSDRASSLWTALTETPSSDVVRGLAWLGIGRLRALEVLKLSSELDKKALGEAENSILSALLSARELFSKAGLRSGMAQSHILAGDFYYWCHKPEQARDELASAIKLFENIGHVKGVVEAELLAALGEWNSGERNRFSSAILRADEAAINYRSRGVKGWRVSLRVPASDVTTLLRFIEKLPVLRGGSDVSSFVSSLPVARDFHNWAMKTNDPLLQVISLSILIKVLKTAGYEEDVLYYKGIRTQLYEQYTKTVPLNLRMCRSALLTYDVALRQERFHLGFDGLDLLLIQMREVFPSLLEAMLSVAEKHYIDFYRGKSEKEIKKMIEKYLELVFIRIDKIQEATKEFKDSRNTGNMKGMVTALDSVFANLSSLIEINFSRINLQISTQNEEGTLDLEGDAHKNVRIEFKLNSKYFVETVQSSGEEICHLGIYLRYIRDLTLAAVKSDENIASGAAGFLTKFYDHFADTFTPPPGVDVPFNLTFSTEIDALEQLLEFPGAEKREKSLKEALAHLRKSYGNKLFIEEVPSLKDYLDSSDLAVNDYLSSNYDLKAENLKVLVDEREADIENGVKVVKIHHAYEYNLPLKKDADVRTFPATSQSPSPRLISIRMGNSHSVEDYYVPRFEKLLESYIGSDFIKSTIADTPLGEIINTIRKRSVFDRLLRAGILCLPASWQDDFIQLYGEERSFSELQSLIQSDAALRQGLLSIAHMKASDLSGVDDENRDLTKEMNEFLQTWLTFIRSFQRNGHGLELIKIASLLCSMEQLLDYPPLLLLLLGEEEAAAAWADRANNLLKHSQPESPKRQHSLSTSLIDRPSKLSPRKAFSLKLALALYYMATKNYKDACTILGNLAENLGDESLGERFQLYFLVDACHSSMNEKAAEPEALAKCIRDLDRLRATLRTRERAKILGPIRREIYERYLEVLRGSENKQEMALVLANYKKPSAKYAPPLSENATEPSMARATLQHLIFLFDVLSREQVWKPRGVFQLLAEFVGTLGFSGRSSIIDSRETTLSALNSIANVMIDETMEEAPFRPYDRTAPALPREEGELLISYFVGRKGLQVITQDAKSSTETHFVRIERAELQEMCREFLQKIKDELDVDQEAAKLFRVLLGQVEDLSSYHKLLIWPDGPLHLIPFQALKKSTDSGYLVESHIISYFSGASPIVIPTSNDNQRLSLLAVADPDGSLQSTQVEAKRIIQTLNQAKPEPLIGENATLNNISRLASGASHIHFATHGRFNSSHPGFSYLQLADRSRLYSIDLGGIAFGGKHVFLSACQTRIGEYLPGDDVYGICDAFLAAGASSVVATLWNVKDASTGEFAALYYELLSGGATPPDALSTVAQKFISQEVWLNDQGEIILLNHPRYWAAFNFILTAHE